MRKCKYLLLTILMLLLAGCAKQPATGEPNKIALIVKSTQSEFFQAVFAGAEAASSEYNVELHISGCETEEDYEAQNLYIRQAVDDGAKAIVLSAVNYDENAAAIDAAAAQGLAIVVIDSDVNSKAVKIRIGTDNVEAGHQAAFAALAAQEGPVVIGIVNIDAMTRNGQEREQGVREIAAQDERIKSIYTTNVLTEQEAAKQGTLALLEEHPDINVLIGLNEQTSVGAAMAIEELGMEGRIRMVGFDSNVQTVDLMRSGTVSALIVQNPYAMGYLGIEMAQGLLTGESSKPESHLDTATTTITPENMFSAEGQKALFPFNS